MPDSTNQGGSQPNADPSKSAEASVDPFANINLDELPDDVRANLTQAKTTYQKTVDDAKTAESRRVQSEEFARTQQSRADKATAALQRHNLSVDGNPATPPAAEDPYVAKFLADGLSEAQAKSYAKLFASSAEIQRASILRELTPLAQTVGNIQADSVLASAGLEYAKYMSIPEVAKEVRDNATVLVNKNQLVDKATVDSLVRLAYGEYMMKNPQGIPQNPTGNAPVNVPTFGGTMYGGGGYVPANATANQAPTAKEPETVAAMSAIVKHFRADMKPIKK